MIDNIKNKYFNSRFYMHMYGALNSSIEVSAFHSVAVLVLLTSKVLLQLNMPAARVCFA